MGANLVLAGSTPTPPNAKLRKTARATERFVPYATAASATEWLRGECETAFILALEITDRSLAVGEFDLPPDVVSGARNLILVPGSEAAGVSPELLQLCDAAVHLPMHGRNTSLNVAVALGVAAYLLIGQLPTTNR